MSLLFKVTPSVPPSSSEDKYVYELYGLVYRQPRKVDVAIFSQALFGPHFYHFIHTASIHELMEDHWKLRSRAYQAMSWPIFVMELHLIILAISE